MSQNLVTDASAKVAHLDYKLFDCDNHILDQRDCCTRYMPTAFKEWAVHARPNAEGIEEVWFGDQRLPQLTGEISFERAMRPGTLIEKLRAMGKTGDGMGDYVWDPMQPEYQHRDARLAAMDAQNVEGCLLFPDLALYLDHPIIAKNPEMQYLNIRAYNEWFHEEWGFSYKDRIFGIPMISLTNLERAIEELEWIVQHGAKAFHIRPGPVNGRHPSDPYFDPFWARANEAGLTIAIHNSESTYCEILGPAWGEDPNVMAMRQSPFQWFSMFGARPIMDTIASFVFSGFFEAFPKIHLMSVEHGAEWLPHLLSDMDKCRGLAKGGRWLRGRTKERSSEIARRHVRVTPYPEDNVAKIADELGHTDMIVFGSDWPHAEGTKHPGDFIELLSSFDEPTVRAIMRDKGRELVGLSK